MKLAGILSVGSGTTNEDAAGYIEDNGDVVAAWVFDGVTGVNARPLLDVPSEPAWFVAEADAHLRDVVMAEVGVAEVLRALVPRLIDSWQTALQGQTVPEGYDLPAACLTLAKRVSNRWQVLRLGDSTIIHRGNVLQRVESPPTDLPDLESELRQKAAVLRESGRVDFSVLRETLRSRLLDSRRQRNVNGSYSILVPDPSSLAMPQIVDLGTPSQLLLCTDGYYRAVDTYGMHDDSSLVATSARPGGAQEVVDRMRDLEAHDLNCERYPRFKPSDDVSAVMLIEQADS